MRMAAYRCIILIGTAWKAWEELYELGMEEYLGGDGIAVVEWPTRCPEAVPESYLEITFTPLGEDTREITWRSVGNFRTIPQEV